MLDIKVVKNERDFYNLHILENLAIHPHLRDSDRYFGIARLDDLPVGYWSGICSKKTFTSAYIFVTEDYQGRSFGYELKKHQLEFAKSLGYNLATSTVGHSNLKSLAIQEKCGGEIEVGDLVSRFTFDLKNLDFQANYF